MGCGASSDAEPPAAAPVTTYAAPPPRDGESEWSLTVPASSLEEVAAGAVLPTSFLVVHDNKKPEAPRLSVVSLLTGTLSPVTIQDEGLAAAKDLEALFSIPPEIAGSDVPMYITMASCGDAFLFKVSLVDGTFVAHSVSPFKLVPPVIPDRPVIETNCEGARAYVDGGLLYLEYASRGGIGYTQLEDGTKPALVPWVARTPLDLSAIQAGTFAPDPTALDVSFWPVVDGDATVRQCADLGQAVGLAKYGQLHVAAYDDEENETDFRSYVVERLGAPEPGGEEAFKPLFKIYGAKIEAIVDLTPALSIFATDDESKGSYLSVFNRYSGLAWKVVVQVPEGLDPQLFGISGISPIDTYVPPPPEPEYVEERRDGDEE